MNGLDNKTFISHGLGGSEVQDQSVSRFGVWWELTSWLADGCLLVASWAESRERKQALMSHLLRAVIPRMRAPLTCPNYFPKAPSSNTITMELRISVYEFGGNMLSPQHHKPKLLLVLHWADKYILGQLKIRQSISYISFYFNHFSISFLLFM